MFYLVWVRQWVAGRPTLAPSYTNPVIPGDFPQPSILAALNDYWAFSTGPSVNLRVLRSVDLIQWTDSGEGMPKLGVWAEAGSVRSPDVAPGPRRGYILYYTAREKASGRLCIGLATAEKPGGPYDDTRETPLVCGINGATDPYAFIDEGSETYLLWTDASLQSSIMIQRVTRDGLGLQGEPMTLLTVDQAWEGGAMGAPTLIKRAGRYLLLYSTPGGIGYAVGDRASGPLTKATTPLIAASSATASCIPTGQAVILDAIGQDWLVYEGCGRWTTDGGRQTTGGVRMDRLVVEGGRLSVVVAEGAQAAPVLRR